MTRKSPPQTPSPKTPRPPNTKLRGWLDYGMLRLRRWFKYGWLGLLFIVNYFAGIIKKTKLRGWLDYGPLGLFFIANYFAGIMWGTAILVISTAIALLISWRLDKRVPMLALVGGCAVAFFGGLTLFFDNALFIKIKPTIISLLIAFILAGGHMIGRNPLKLMLGSKMTLSDRGWMLMNWVWIAMFCTTALANEIAWRHLSTDDWVTFKTFGLTGLSLGFALFTVPIIAKHGNIEQNK